MKTYKTPEKMSCFGNTFFFLSVVIYIFFSHSICFPVMNGFRFFVHFNLHALLKKLG